MSTIFNNSLASSSLSLVDSCALSSTFPFASVSAAAMLTELQPVEIFSDLSNFLFRKIPLSCEQKSESRAYFVFLVEVGRPCHKPSLASVHVRSTNSIAHISKGSKKFEVKFLQGIDCQTRKLSMAGLFSKKPTPKGNFLFNLMTEIYFNK